MKKKIIISLAAIAALIMTGCSSSTPEQREARRYNDEGNRLYADSRYAEAEAAYTKAVNSDPANLEAKYNLALSMVKQAGPGESGKELLEKARKLFAEVAESSSAPESLASGAAYNIGNMAYNVEQYDPAIEAYKQSLRLVPDDDLARENLRMAQLKKKENEQNKDNQNQDQNKDQDKQNKDQNKDQDKQDQQQNQDQQNQDKNDQKPPQPKPESGISDENAEKILKAMENAEAATRRRVQEAEKKAGSASRRTVTNPW